FAVALYRGASSLGDFSAPERPADGTAMREVNPAYSRAMLQQFQHIQQGQTDGINFGIGTTIGQMDDVVAGDKIDDRGAQGFINQPTAPVSQVFGTQRNINTGGGAYAEGSVDNRQGTFVKGDQFNMSGNFQGANVNIKSALTNVAQSIGAMPHGDQAEK